MSMRNKAGEMKENQVATCLGRFLTQLRQRCCRDDGVLRGCCSLPAVFAQSGSHNLGPKAGRRSRRPGTEAASLLLMLQRGKIQRTPPEKHGFSDVLRVRSIKVACAWKRAAHANVHTQTVKLTGDIRRTEWGQDPVWGEDMMAKH